MRILNVVSLWLIATAPLLGWAQAEQRPIVGQSRKGGTSTNQARQDDPKGAIERVSVPMHDATTFVPLDSWVYPLFDRAVGLGLIKQSFAGLRPWTRMQCAVLVRELGIAAIDTESEYASQAYGTLAREFGPELERLKGNKRFSVELESMYVRLLGISGEPLTDGYHFGETLINDYGRPYQEGANGISGLSVRTSGLPVAFYFRGEYQHAPANAGYSSDALALISHLDGTVIQSNGQLNRVNRFQVMEGYAAFGLKNLQFTIGKQSLSWGQSSPGAMLMSDHAAPFYMLRADNLKPIRLPVLARLLGPVRGEFFFGQLSGHQYPEGPWIHGQKISFKPTTNLQLGFSRVVVFAGEGRPLSFRSFWKSFASVGNHLQTGPDSGLDVGDRRGGFDINYRVPHLRDWLTLYAEGFTDDDPSPLSAPQRSGWNLGLYMPRIPRIAKLDLRLEGSFTDSPAIRHYKGTFFYWNGAYRDSHTNENDLLGSWVGRQGHGVLARSTYWLAGASRVQLQYRRGTIDDSFVPNGGTLNDIRISHETAVQSNLFFSSTLQYERWKVPVLSAKTRGNATLSFGLNYQPSWRFSSK
jgi:hypothetical protein